MSRRQVTHKTLQNGMTGNVANHFQVKIFLSLKSHTNLLEGDIYTRIHYTHGHTELFIIWTFNVGYIKNIANFTLDKPLLKWLVNQSIE